MAVCIVGCPVQETSFYGTPGTLMPRTLSKVIQMLMNLLLPAIVFTFSSPRFEKVAHYMTDGTRYNMKMVGNRSAIGVLFIMYI